MTIHLLDINVLLALADPMHLHHNLCRQWFAEKGQSAWATCPLTENGFIRIASHPKYPNRPGDVQTVGSILRQFCAASGHHFWTDDLSVLNILKPEAVVTHAQITDLYLLGLAIHHGGKLATLDQRIPVGAVPEGRAALASLLN